MLSQDMEDIKRTQILLLLIKTVMCEMKDTLDKINLWIDISEKEICKFQKKKKKSVRNYSK